MRTSPGFLKWVCVILAVGALVIFRSAIAHPQHRSLAAHELDALLFGWMEFTQRNFPNIRVDVGSVAFAVVVAALIWTILYVSGRRWGLWGWRTPLVLICIPAVLFAIVLSAAGIQARTTEIIDLKQRSAKERSLR